jgi:hypothetical protein
MTGAAHFLSTIASHLDACGIQFMVTGSLVSSFYGDSRTTRDIDFVVNAQEPPDDTITSFVGLCEGAGMYVATNAALGIRPESSRRQFYVIDSISGWKADIMWMADRAFSRTEFNRRVPAQLLGVSVMIPTPEDIVLAKLEWGGSTESRQFDDAVSVMRVLADRIDFAYLAKWAGELAIETSLSAAVEQLHLGA